MTPNKKILPLMPPTQDMTSAINNYQIVPMEEKKPGRLNSQ
jgi:hypothetical protein